jgi:hypothetical protein
MTHAGVAGALRSQTRFDRVRTVHCLTRSSCAEALGHRARFGLPRLCRFETTTAGCRRQLALRFTAIFGQIQGGAAPERAGTGRADCRFVPNTNRIKSTAATIPNQPAVKKPDSGRPMSSRPPVAARVDVVVANLERDPRRK